MEGDDTEGMLKYRIAKKLHLIEKSNYKGILRPLIGVSLQEVYIEEAYRKTDEQMCIDFVYLLKDFLNGEISTDLFLDFQEQHDFELHAVDGEEIIHADYRAQSRKIYLYLSQDILGKISQSKDLEDIAKNIWANFMHEDTHAQQQKASKVDIKRNYIPPESLDWEDDFEKSLAYFDQAIEADAYGRGIAGRLIAQYSEKKDIYKDVAENTVKDAYAAKVINIYKNPKCKNSKKFFRAFFDVLQGNDL